MVQVSARQRLGRRRNEKKDDEERKNDARGKVWKARATDARGAAGGTHIDGKR